MQPGIFQKGMLKSYTRFNGFFDEEEHIREDDEIFYVMSGRGVYRIDGNHYKTSRGTFILVREGQRCALQSDGNMVIYRIHYDFDWIRSMFAQAKEIYGGITVDEYMHRQQEKRNVVIHFESVDRERVEWMIHDMHREISFKEENWEAVFSTMMYMLFLTVFRRIGQRNRGTIQMNQEFLEYIRTRTNEKLTMKLLARECCYNPTYFSRIFRERFGVTVTDYINICRVENAKKLLMETDLTCEAITAEVGFPSKSAFYKKFLEKTGMTPNHWRTRHRP